MIWMNGEVCAAAGGDPSVPNFYESERTIMQATQEKVILPYEPTEEYYVEPAQVTEKAGYAVLKRMFDVLASVFGLLVLALPMIVIGIAVLVCSGGCVLYRQERLGKDGVPFMIFKFRTMVRDAEEDGPQWAQGEEDPRVTPVGRFLRRYHLDELPQLWNILRGEMSFVGPRPERAVFYEQFERYIHGFRERLKVIPGLTGYAQVNGGYDLRPEEKIVYDMEYIKNRSLGLDIKCIWMTFGLLFRHPES